MPWHELKLKLKRNSHFLSAFLRPGFHWFSDVIKSRGRRQLHILQHLVHCGGISTAFYLSYKSANVAYSRAALDCLRGFLGFCSPVAICLLYAKIKATAHSSVCILSPHGWVLGYDMVK